MAIECTHRRKDNRIKDLTTNETKTYGSNNEAKRASRKIQLAANGNLGRGSLEVFKDERRR